MTNGTATLERRPTEHELVVERLTHVSIVDQREFVDLGWVWDGWGNATYHV